VDKQRVDLNSLFYYCFQQLNIIRGIHGAEFVASPTPAKEDRIAAHEESQPDVLDQTSDVEATLERGRQQFAVLPALTIFIVIH
jgi:hypothetical protein